MTHIAALKQAVYNGKAMKGTSREMTCTPHRKLPVDEEARGLLSEYIPELHTESVNGDKTGKCE